MAPTTLRSFQRSLISHPNVVYVPLAAFIALFALGPSPSFFPLILLLATVKLYITTIGSRLHSSLRLFVMVCALSLAMAVANIAPSYSALPAHVTAAMISLEFATTLNCAAAVFIVYLDRRYRPTVHTPWIRLTLFPTMWATALLLVSSISPIGRLATWSPVTGLHAYTWVRPYFGTVGIDWIVGAWADVLHELLGMWIMGPRMQVISLNEGAGEAHLISFERDDASVSSDGDRQPQQAQRSRTLLYLSALLCCLAIPSYYISLLPVPLVSPSTTSLSLACALPLPPNVENENNKPGLDDFLHETQILVGLAKVVLWPEGALRFETYDEKKEVIDYVAQYAAGSIVAASFEDVTSLKSKNISASRRQGIMLIDKDGLIYEYYRRNLIPFVEQGPISKIKPQIFEYELVLKRNSRGKVVESVNVPLTAGISLDFASSSPFSLAKRPAVILGSAHTWHPSIGTAMWEQAKARAQELGSALLWCDGGNEGVSGVVAPGIEEILQVGSGSWVRSIGLPIPLDDSRTPYGRFGTWLAIPFIWALFGSKWTYDRVVRNLKAKDVVELTTTAVAGAWCGVTKFWKKRYDNGERTALLDEDD